MSNVNQDIKNAIKQSNLKFFSFITKRTNYRKKRQNICYYKSTKGGE